MMDKIMRIVKGWWLIGLIVGGLSMAIAWAIGYFKIPTVTIIMSTIDVRSQLNAGISPAAGSKVLSYLQGIVPTSAAGIIAVLISAFLAVIVGRIVYEFLPLDKWLFKETAITRLITVLVFGTLVVAGVLAMTFSFPGIAALVALAIYAAILSGLLILGHKYIKFPEIPA